MFPRKRTLPTSSRSPFPKLISNACTITSASPPTVGLNAQREEENLPILSHFPFHSPSCFVPVSFHSRFISHYIISFPLVSLLITDLHITDSYIYPSRCCRGGVSM